MALCPCGSQQELDRCCGPYLAGQPAPTAEALMRSRYTAFVKKQFDYIEKTGTERANQEFSRAEIEASAADTEWRGLDILDKTDGGVADTTGIVRFAFHYRYKGQNITQTEIASFQRVNGVWLYDNSEINPKEPPVRVEQIGRNDPCPCGSGKKYKKCCGQ